MADRLTVGTCNVGTRGARKADPDAVRQLALECDALCLQQLSGPEGDRLVHHLRVHPELRVIRRSRRAGQAAVGLAFRPDTLQLHRPVFRLLVPGQPLNAGTGPDHLKPKWLAGGVFEHRASDERVTIASTHRVAGQTPEGHTIRDKVSMRHARRVGAELLGAEWGYKIVGGDWNSRAADDSLRPLARAGWTCDQLESERRLATHGHGWAPDHIWWKRAKGLVYLGHELGRRTGGDHRPLLATFRM